MLPWRLLHWNCSCLNAGNSFSSNDTLNACLSVSLDLSAAFDTVDHHGTTYPLIFVRCSRSNHFAQPGILFRPNTFLPFHHLITKICKSLRGTVMDSRAFHVAAPKEWNRLPVFTCCSISFSSFKKRVKTHYCSLAFKHNIYGYLTTLHLVTH